MCSRNSLLVLGLILVLMPMIAVALPRNITKRSTSFFDLDCKGTYNKSYFFRLDRICEDCYSLFREPQLLTMCKYVRQHQRNRLQLKLIHPPTQCTTETINTPFSILFTTFLWFPYHLSLLLISRKDCFTTMYFKGCVEALQLSDEISQFKKFIQVVNGATPDTY